MKANFTLLLFFLFILSSCNNKPKVVEEEVVYLDSASSVPTDTIPKQENDENTIGNEELEDIYLENLSYRNIRIFEPRAYEYTDNIKELFKVMKPLKGLVKKGNAYVMKNCKITKTNIFDSECNDVPFIEPTLDIRENILFLFENLSAKEKDNMTTAFADFKFWANRKKEFTFNGIPYSLESEGTVLSSSESDEEYFENIRNYKLYFKSGNKSQCIIQMKYFVDTITEIRYIGDIDDDGKPDLIISSPDHYESNRILLFLSSMAEGDDLIKLVSITADSFGC